MTAYIIRRLLLAIFCLFMITLIIFFAMRLLPGDPIIIYIGQSTQLSTLSEEGVQKLREEFGLDKPILAQYLKWVSGVVRFDFGRSIFYHMPVSTLLRERYPVTLNLGLEAFIISTVLGIGAGALAAVKRGKLADRIVTPLSYVGITIPVFWLGVMMIYVLGLQFRWLPIIGYTSPFDDFWMSTKQAIMPVICLSVGALAGIARQARSSMLEVVRQDYIRTAWSKGLSERVVIIKHALKNSLIPVVTVLGLQLGFIFGGSVIVETVFSVPGIGSLMVTSIFAQDYSVVQSCTLVFAVVVVVANLIVDITYGWLDPRIQYA
ncbi:MAG: peptide ABC transporter [Chloroflexi bacterium RBG_16_56_11]|nr:MAG: peptide ABC transporter [Chloroflexi bacterium RBG_16_56_11]